MENVKLSNGLVMPRVGLGVWKVPINATAKMVATAIENNYALIEIGRAHV